MKSPEIEKLLEKLAFLSAMQEVFNWPLPLPDYALEALKALLQLPEFDDILKETRPSITDGEFDHYRALANDRRVQFFLKSEIAKAKKREEAAQKDRQADYVSNFLLFLGHEFKLGLRNRLRRWLNPPDHRESSHGSSDSVRVTAVPVAVSPAARHPVLKGTALVLVSYAAYFAYHHPPDLKITMIAPEKFPKVEMDSRGVRFDKVRFDDVRFEKPPELQVAKLRFGDPPTLPLGKVHFDTPQPFNVNPLTLSDKNTIRLDPTKITISFDSSPLKFAPLEVKTPDPFKLQLDPNAQPLQVNVNHSFDSLFGSHPEATFTDKRQGFFRPTHTYTWDIKSANPPAPQNSQQGTSGTVPAAKTTQDQKSSKPGSQASTATNPNSKSAIAGGETDQR